MAGPGGGPPRRSHTKSRKGCDTCKRRHIRCDENFPQCRNCTKHNVKCPYMDMPAQDDIPSSPERADLLWTSETETQTLQWQRTAEFPFPNLDISPLPQPQYFTTEECRLILHIASVCAHLRSRDTIQFTIWASKIPLFLQIGSTQKFVMHALLALSASHIAWQTECCLVAQMAEEHRGVAIKGLHEAIGLFSPANSDAVLAASLLLSWQASEWRGWTQHMHGTSSVIDAMAPWKHESQFGDFIAEQSTFPTAPPSPLPNSHLSQPRKVDLDTLQYAYAQLQHIEKIFLKIGQDESAIRRLKDFLFSVQQVSELHTPAQRFDILKPLRTWLFWLPVMYLQQDRDNAYDLVVLAYYYTIWLVVEPLFDGLGTAYFGSMSLRPVEEIARRLFSTQFKGHYDNSHTPLAMMEYPIDMVTKFRRRMGWVSPTRTASFPTFDHTSIENLNLSSPSIYASGSNPTFSYSQEHLSTFPGPLPLGTSLKLEMFAPSGHNLGIPANTPSYGVYHGSGLSLSELVGNDRGNPFNNHFANTGVLRSKSYDGLPSPLSAHASVFPTPQFVLHDASIQQSQTSGLEPDTPQSALFPPHSQHQRHLQHRTSQPNLSSQRHKSG